MRTMAAEPARPRVLLSGASSFSGMWIAEALAARGCHVVATFRQAQGAYGGLRGERVRRVAEVAVACFEADLTTSAIDAVLDRHGPFDVFAHHAAAIENYRDPAYDVGEGVRRNTEGVRRLFRRLKEGGARRVIATGTTFEADERLSGPESLAVSPYGLSKTLTNQALRHFARWEGLDFARFVVAAPFGPWEEGRLVWSLFQAWMQGRPGVVRTPAYVRDNLPVDLLARAYADLVTGGSRGPDDVVRPAGFVGEQGAFALRVAREAQARLGRPCLVQAADQTEFPEPRVRVNDEPAIPADWDEAAFWDAYVGYYRRVEQMGLLQARPA